MSDIVAFGIPGGWEWVIVLVVGLLIFGRRLPEIARSVGKSVVEFKKGLKDVKGEIETASNQKDPNMLPPGTQKPEPEPSTPTIGNSATNNSTPNGSGSP